MDILSPIETFEAILALEAARPHPARPIGGTGSQRLDHPSASSRVGIKDAGALRAQFRRCEDKEHHQHDETVRLTVAPSPTRGRSVLMAHN